MEIGKGNLGVRFLCSAIGVFGVNDLKGDDRLGVGGSFDINSNWVYMYHKEGAEEGGLEGSDIPFLDSPLNSRVDFYIRNPNSNPNRLTQDSRPLESMTSYEKELVGVGLPLEGIEASMVYWTNGGFENLNIIEILKTGDDIEIARFDAKRLAEAYPDPSLQFDVENGLSKKLVTEFYSSADVNMDGIVNYRDVAYFHSKWGMTITPGLFARPEDFTDVNRDGYVGNLDLIIVFQQWLDRKQSY
jgi:hypothetical protein